MTEPDAHNDDIVKELRELKEWKQNIGLKAVLSAEHFEKELGELQQYKKELIETQRESLLFQQQLQVLNIEKDDAAQQLQSLQEEINFENTKQNESHRLSQEALLIKDEEIEKLTFKVETLEINTQILETQISSKNEQCKAQEMEMNEFNQEIEKLKMDKNEVTLQLNEYKENEKDIKINNKMLSQQLNEQQTEFTNIIKENKKINKQFKELQLKMKNVAKDNQLLVSDNEKYKQLLTKLRETENNLQQKHNAEVAELHDFERRFDELTQKYQRQCDKTINAEMRAAEYNDQIEEMKHFSESEHINSRSDGLPHGRSLLPQRTMARLTSSRKMILNVPSIPNSFRLSTAKLLTSVASSFLDSPRYNYNGLQTRNYNYDDTDTDSVNTQSSFMADQDFTIKPDGAVRGGTGSRKSSRQLLVETVNTAKNSVNNEEKQENEAFKLEEEIKKEMRELQEQLQREYNVEFEKKKEELIGAHDESLLFMTKEHNKLKKQVEDIQNKYRALLMEKEPIKLSTFARLLSYIFAF